MMERNYKVYDEDGREVDFDVVVELMDDDLREAIAAELAPCTNQEFFDEYAKRHEERFGESFAPAVGGAY